MKLTHLITSLLLTISFSLSYAQLEQIQLPPGFEIDIYADNLPGARQMALAEDGTLFVSTRGQGNVYAVLPGDNMIRGGEIITVLENMNSPNGITVRDGALYVAEIDRVLRYDNILENLTNRPEAIIVNDSFPDHPHHGWKYIKFGPDNKLYVPVGAPCNVCLETDQRFASIMRMHPDGSDLEIYAHGVRNSVGFDFHPETGELWFTSNGRDMMGDDIPPDTLNYAPKQGLHFGFPFCHTLGIIDPEFGEHDFIEQGCKPASYLYEQNSPYLNNLPETITDASAKLAPHTAALGMVFYTGNMFPTEYQQQIFIAEHGSWNRSKRMGYRITLVTLNGNEVTSYQPFATGWLDTNSQHVVGRPVDILVMPDGALLVSDDFSDKVYRISFVD